MSNNENTLNQRPKTVHAFGSTTKLTTPMKEASSNKGFGSSTPRSALRPSSSAVVSASATKLRTSASTSGRWNSTSIRTPLKSLSANVNPAVTASASRKNAKNAKLQAEADRIQKVVELKQKWKAEKEKKVLFHNALKQLESKEMKAISNQIHSNNVNKAKEAKEKIRQKKAQEINDLQESLDVERETKLTLQIQKQERKRQSKQCIEC